MKSLIVISATCKQITLIIFMLILVLVFSCRNFRTYQDKIEKEQTIPPSFDGYKGTLIIEISLDASKRLVNNEFKKYYHGDFTVIRSEKFLNTPYIDGFQYRFHLKITQLGDVVTTYLSDQLTFPKDRKFPSEFNLTSPKVLVAIASSLEAHRVKSKLGFL
jgi:hypothetical protein